MSFEKLASLSDQEAKTTVDKICRYICHNQSNDGAIPWFKNYKLDPWDHCEAIMALNINKDYDHALRAFHWLKDKQNLDGSWYAKYLGDLNDGDSDRAKIETNFVAYPATALWHYYLCSQNKRVLVEFFPMINKAIDFVVSLQQAEGDIQWAVSEKEKLPTDALITACSSILRSFECAIFIAEALGCEKKSWLSSYRKLKDTLRNKPWRFDRTWESKERFSMDWFYPILSGALSLDEAKIKIAHHRSKFIVDEYGCKCVSDEPWVTIAESSELVISLVAASRDEEAKEILNKLLRWQDADGGFWTGYQLNDNCIWPKEKTTWTAAAVALAHDAVYKLSPAATLFTSPSRI